MGFLTEAAPVIGMAGNIYGGIKRYRDARRDRKAEQELRRAQIDAQRIGFEVDRAKLAGENRRAVAASLFKQAEADEAALTNPNLILDENQRAFYVNRAARIRNAASRYMGGDDNALADVYDANDQSLNGGAPGPSFVPQGQPQGPAPAPWPSFVPRMPGNGTSSLSGEPNPLVQFGGIAPTRGIPFAGGAVPVGPVQVDPLANAIPEPANPVAAMAARLGGANPLFAVPRSQQLALQQTEAGIADTKAGTGLKVAQTGETTERTRGLRSDSNVKEATEGTQIEMAAEALREMGTRADKNEAEATDTRFRTKRGETLLPGEELAQRLGNSLHRLNIAEKRATLPYAGLQAEANLNRTNAGARLDSASAGLIEQTTDDRKALLQSQARQNIASAGLAEAKRKTEEATRQATIALMNSQRNYQNALAAARNFETNRGQQTLGLFKKSLQASIAHTEALTANLRKNGLIPEEMAQEWETAKQMMSGLSNADPMRVAGLLQDFQLQLDTLQRKTNVVVGAQRRGMSQTDAVKLVRVIEKGVSKEEAINRFRAFVNHPDPNLRISPQQFKNYQRAINEAYGVMAIKPQRPAPAPASPTVP